MRWQERTLVALGVLAILAILVFVGWLHFAGPCSWQRWEPAKDLPARCVTYFRDH